MAITVVVMQTPVEWLGVRRLFTAAITAPPANERTDYEYNANQRLVKMKLPLPNGQTTRPEMSVSTEYGSDFNRFAKLCRWLALAKNANSARWVSELRLIQVLDKRGGYDLLFTQNFNRQR